MRLTLMIIALFFAGTIDSNIVTDESHLLAQVWLIGAFYAIVFDVCYLLKDMGKK